jgi:putative oxidoreductase
MALSGSSRLAPLFLRLAAGAILMYHGYEKCITKDVQEFVNFTASFGLPYNDILAQVAAWGELVGGGMLILGLGTRLAALVNAGTMVVALWKVHLGTDLLAGMKNLPEYEFPLAILAACSALLFLGGGALSVDSFIAGKKSPNPKV